MTLSMFQFYKQFYLSYGGVNQASKITGPKRRPSQSPSMRLLSMLHVHDDPEGISMTHLYIIDFIVKTDLNLFMILI